MKTKRTFGRGASIGKWLLPLFLLAIGAPADGQPEKSDYQDRGDRFEGRRRHPVGGNEIELIGAMVEGTEPLGSLPAELALSFYLHEEGEPRIVVRERQPRKEYWLDQVRPTQSWLVRSVNRFTWPASAALAELQVDPANLLALVRLGYGSPRVSELVAPAQLAGPKAAFPDAGAVYRFTFLMSRPAEVEARLNGCTGEVTPARLESPRRLAFDIRVILNGKGSQLCRLDLEGEMLDDAARVAQSVSFYRAAAGAAR